MDIEVTILELIGNWIKAGAAYFNIGYMLLFFLAGQAIKSQTGIKSWSKGSKQFVIWFLGLILGAAWLFSTYTFEGMKAMVALLPEIGVSYFSTILFYESIYRWVYNKFLKKEVKEEKSRQ